MKKLFTFIAIAALAVACCNKQPAVLSVEKFFENPVVGETTVSGTVLSIVCPDNGWFVMGAADDFQKQLLVKPDAEIKICKGLVGKEINVKGVVGEYIVNEEAIAALEEEAEGMECAEMKECKQQMTTMFKEKFEEQGQYALYYIDATEITCKDSCKKEEKGCGEKKEGCDEKKEGCGEKKEGCCKGEKEGCGEKKEGCCKDGKKEGCGEKKEGCCKGEKEGCEKKCNEEK